MKTEEANRILVKFEYGEARHDKDIVKLIKRGLIGNYTKDLNSLVSIWEELNWFPSFEHNHMDSFRFYCGFSNLENSVCVIDAKTIQEAAAIATAKAISALEGGK